MSAIISVNFINKSEYMLLVALLLEGNISRTLESAMILRSAIGAEEDMTFLRNKACVTVDWTVTDIGIDAVRAYECRS